MTIGFLEVINNPLYPDAMNLLQGCVQTRASALDLQRSHDVQLRSSASSAICLHSAQFKAVPCGMSGFLELSLETNDSNSSFVASTQPRHARSDVQRQYWQSQCRKSIYKLSDRLNFLRNEVI